MIDLQIACCRAQRFSYCLMYRAIQFDPYESSIVSVVLGLISEWSGRSVPSTAGISSAFAAFQPLQTERLVLDTKQTPLWLRNPGRFNWACELYAKMIDGPGNTPTARKAATS